MRGGGGERNRKGGGVTSGGREPTGHQNKVDLSFVFCFERI